MNDNTGAVLMLEEVMVERNVGEDGGEVDSDGAGNSDGDKVRTTPM